MAFMRKYIHVAKEIKPVLTREAADYISDEYSKLRSQDSFQQDNVARVSCHVKLQSRSSRTLHHVQ